MHYCGQCGASLKRIFSTLCSQCNNNDELNGPYCIMCGASCEQISHPNSDVLSEPIPTVELVDRAQTKEDAPRTWMPRITNHKEVILAGLCLGIAVGYSLIFLSRLSGGGGGTTSSDNKGIGQALTIHTQEPYASITIEDDQHRHRVSTNLKADGSLTLSTLPSGHYIISVAAPNHKAILKSVTIIEGSPTVLDFAKPIGVPAY